MFYSLNHFMHDSNSNEMYNDVKIYVLCIYYIYIYVYIKNIYIYNACRGGGGRVYMYIFTQT